MRTRKRSILQSATCLLLTFAFWPAQAEAARGLSNAVDRQIRLLRDDRARILPSERKLATALRFALKRRRGDDRLFRQLPRLRTGTRLPTGPAGRTRVQLRGSVGPDLLAAIDREGGVVLNAVAEHGSVVALVPLEAVSDLARRADVGSIHPAYPAITSKLNTSEGDAAHRADLLRTAFGVIGSGVKTCVISDSFNTQGNVDSLIASGDLPGPGNPDGFFEPVDVVADLSLSASDEGAALLEIVFDLAPGSSLGFATAGNSKEEFAQNVTALGQAGCDIIVDDIAFTNEAILQDDVVAQAINNLAASNVVYFSAAGNSSARGSWRGDFAPTSPPPGVGAPLEQAHDFGAGSINEITSDGLFFSLQWSDPFGGSGNDYDLYMLDPAGENVIAASLFWQNGDDDPVELINSLGFDDRGNLLVVTRDPMAMDRFIAVDTFRGRLAVDTLEGTMRAHPCAEHALAVAAVRVPAVPPFDGTESVEGFSSSGPCRLFFDGDGNELTPGDLSSTGGVTREKPDVTAANRVSTATPGFDNFAGTSASAPHAAAIAALWRSLIPGLTRSDIVDSLAATALDIGAAGRDLRSGWGIVDALAGAEWLTGSLAVLPGTDVSVSPFDGIGQQPVTLTFSEVVSAGTVAVQTTVSGPADPSGLLPCGEDAFFDISSSVGSAGSTDVCIDADVTSCAAARVELGLFDAGAWTFFPARFEDNRYCASPSALGTFTLLLADDRFDNDIPLPLWAHLVLMLVLGAGGWWQAAHRRRPRFKA